MKDLARDTRGAVYVEFLATFLMMFCFFLLLIQYSFLQTASIIVNHAAAMTARAAIVVLHDDPKKYEGVPMGEFEGARKREIRRAALLVLRPLGGAPEDLVVKMKSKYTRDELVEVRLDFQYSCAVPFARYVLCSGAPPNSPVPDSAWVTGGVEKKLFSAVAALPNQGADFEY